MPYWFARVELTIELSRKVVVCSQRGKQRPSCFRVPQLSKKFSLALIPLCTCDCCLRVSYSQTIEDHVPIYVVIAGDNIDTLEATASGPCQFAQPYRCRLVL